MCRVISRVLKICARARDVRHHSIATTDARSSATWTPRIASPALSAGSKYVGGDTPAAAYACASAR